MTIRTVTYDDATHKVVPLYATPEMLMAIRTVRHRSFYWSGDIWDAMLEAAPELPKVSKSTPLQWQPIETAPVSLHGINSSIKDGNKGGITREECVFLEDFGWEGLSKEWDEREKMRKQQDLEKLHGCTKSTTRISLSAVISEISKGE